MVSQKRCKPWSGLWHKWYAWYPVELDVPSEPGMDCRQWVWCDYIWRRTRLHGTEYSIEKPQGDRTEFQLQHRPWAEYDV